MYLAFPFPKRRFKPHPAVVTMPHKPLTQAEQTADTVIALFETTNADGKAVSMHLVHCAMQAMEAISDLPVIVGALLHNVGALVCVQQGADAAKTAELSATYLRQRGFSERVCAIAEAQPAARRYLAATTAAHPHLNGMTAAEAAGFEQHPYFNDVVTVCRWAGTATGTVDAQLPLSFFRRLVWDHLSCRLA